MPHRATCIAVNSYVHIVEGQRKPAKNKFGTWDPGKYQVPIMSNKNLGNRGPWERGACPVPIMQYRFEEQGRYLMENGLFAMSSLYAV